MNVKSFLTNSILLHDLQHICINIIRDQYTVPELIQINIYEYIMLLLNGHFYENVHILMKNHNDIKSVNETNYYSKGSSYTFLIRDQSFYCM